MNIKNSLNNSTPSITAIILTYNEEKHIERCLLSIKEVVKRIVIIDSFSTDRTLEIVKKYNVEILQNKWINYSKQLNWGIKNANVKTDWILRIDSDECVTENLAKKIKEKLNKFSSNISGLTVNLQLVFFGKKIKYGGLYPQKLLRIWRNGKGKCEDSWMDEHIIVDSGTAHLDGDIVDNNLNNFQWWIDKHNRYSSRKAISFLVEKKNKSSSEKKIIIKNKIIKNKFFYMFPVGLRSFLYFLYRYLFRLGFLNGWRGFLFDFFQGFWFRVLVDAKIVELKKIMKTKGLTLEQAIKSEYGYDI